jgi:hypothetical protein
VSGTPRTHYASRGDLDIAIRYWATAVDLVVMPGPFIPIDSIDNEPSMYRFYRRLASFSRVIPFDSAGWACRRASGRRQHHRRAGRRTQHGDERVGCERHGLRVGFHRGERLLLAADHQAGQQSGIVVARPGSWAPDYDIGAQPTGATRFNTVAMEPDAVEQGFDILKIVAPSVAATAHSGQVGLPRATTPRRRACPQGQPGTDRGRRAGQLPPSPLGR